MGSPRNLAEAQAELMARWEQRVQSLIISKGGTSSAKDFQRAVNVVFHDVEAAHYDELHLEMWESLAHIFDRLVADILNHSASGPAGVLVDVGCGTGLATEFLLRTPLQQRIAQCTMVDTSGEMLARCRARSSGWTVPATMVHGELSTLPDQSADFLVTSSVLHHIPNLFAFCSEIERVLKPGGYFLHVQDPHQGAQLLPAAVERAERLSAARATDWSPANSFPVRLSRRVVNRIRRWLDPRYVADYMDEVNQRLIAAGLVKRRLKPSEIWSITDLRVGDLPYSAVDGVSSDELAQALPSCNRVSIRTYCFFGVMPSRLPPDLAAEERRLFDESSGDGTYLAGVWVRRTK